MKEKIILPNDFKPEGHIKIELFDYFGKKVEEIKTDNFIAPHVKKNLFKHAIVNLFTRNRKTIGKEFDNSDVFRKILLTNANHPEDPDSEMVPRGDIIGWAVNDEVYAGDDEKQGTFNTAESFVKPSHVRFVFDFPTHSGNGSFQSIYFIPEYIEYEDSYLIGGENADVSRLKPYQENLIAMYRKSGKVVFRRLSKEFEILSEWEISTGDTTDGGLYYLSGFTIKGEYIYYATNSYDKKAIIRRAPMSNPTNLSIFKILDLDLYSTTSIYSMEYNQNRGHWYIELKVNRNIYDLYIFDENFNVLDIREDYEYDINYLGDGVFILGKRNITYLENDSISPTDMQKYSMLSSSSYSCVGADDEYFYFRYSSYSVYTMYRTAKAFIGSRSLLDSPVVKTSTNTMKITYDFILE